MSQQKDTHNASNQQDSNSASNSKEDNTQGLSSLLKPIINSTQSLINASLSTPLNMDFTSDQPKAGSSTNKLRDHAQLFDERISQVEGKDTLLVGEGGFRQEVEQLDMDDFDNLEQDALNGFKFNQLGNNNEEMSTIDESTLNLEISNDFKPFYSSLNDPNRPIMEDDLKSRASISYQHWAEPSPLDGHDVVALLDQPLDESFLGDELEASQNDLSEEVKQFESILSSLDLESKFQNKENPTPNEILAYLESSDLIKDIYGDPSWGEGEILISEDQKMKRKALERLIQLKALFKSNNDSVDQAKPPVSL